MERLSIEPLSVMGLPPVEFVGLAADLGLRYRSRHTLYVLDRSRDAARARRLLILAPVVAVLTVILVVAIDLATDATDWRQGLLVAFAGALGATLSLAYNLRDQSPRLRDLRTFWSGFALQAALGAAAGIFVWIVLESGLIHIGGSNATWAINAAVAFVAGFSEPMFLKTVQGLAGLGSLDQPQKAQTD